MARCEEKESERAGRTAHFAMLSHNVVLAHESRVGDNRVPRGVTTEPSSHSAENTARGERTSRKSRCVGNRDLAAAGALGGKCQNLSGQGVRVWNVRQDLHINNTVAALKQ